MSDVTLPAGLAASLDAIRPVLARNAALGAAERRLPDESIDALAGAGLFRLMVPRRYGGHEASVSTLLAAAALVAEADGAAGWVVGLTQVSAWTVGLFGAKAQDEVFGADPDARVCGSLNPAAVAEKVPGGCRLSGRWGYISGSLHSQWATIGFMLPDDGPGGPGVFAGLIPMAELALHDTWRTAGLRGTGSNTLTAADVFVPEHRVMSQIAAAEGRYPTEFTGETAYRAAWVPTLTMALTGPLLGMGRAALGLVRSAAAGKGIVGTGFRRQADSTGFQIQLAEAALRIDSAQLHIFRAAADIDKHAALGTILGHDTRARIRGDAALSARYITEAISVLADAHGSGGFAEASPFHRVWQDANVGARHALLNTAIGLEIYGKALLGVPNDVSPVV